MPAKALNRFAWKIKVFRFLADTAIRRWDVFVHCGRLIFYVYFKICRKIWLYVHSGSYLDVAVGTHSSRKYIPFFRIECILYQFDGCQPRHCFCSINSTASAAAVALSSAKTSSSIFIGTKVVPVSPFHFWWDFVRTLHEQFDSKLNGWVCFIAVRIRNRHQIKQ